jgi:UPF0176 protein
MLHNKLNKQELELRLQDEDFERVTLSFYRYIAIRDVISFRNELYSKLDELRCLGRIYIASEGINAQMSIPKQFLNQFLQFLNSIPELAQMPIKYAIEDDGKSFFKLIVRVRNKIVADGLPDNAFDTANVGNHLSALEFHELLDHPDSVVVDMRNNYESEVGRFKAAICPDAVIFREELELVTKKLEDQKDKKILLYCTGGIRCEKASAYLKHQGFEDVNQLYGGIIEYAQQIKHLNLPSKFIGKNFVFDNRMGERITDDIIAHCHQCGNTCDIHRNCANDQCHMLFIQCAPCQNEYNGCCCEECKNALKNPELYKGVTFKGKKWRRHSGERIILNSELNA